MKDFFSRRARFQEAETFGEMLNRLSQTQTPLYEQYKKFSEFLNQTLPNLNLVALLVSDEFLIELFASYELFGENINVKQILAKYNVSEG